MSELASVSPGYQLREDHGFEGLNPRQWRFVNLVVAGHDPNESYREVYGYETVTPAVKASASELLKNPKVVAKLKSMRQQVEDRATLAPLVTKDFVIKGITQLALNADKDSTRLRAFELLGKMAGVDLFREHVKTVEERSVADIEAELKAKLSSLRQTIDGTSRPVDGPAMSRPVETPAPGPATRKRKPHS